MQKAVGVVVGLVFLTGCAVQAPTQGVPTQIVSPTASSTPSSDLLPSAELPTDTTTPSVPVAETPVVSPSAVPTPVKPAILLSGKGMAEYKFKKATQSQVSAFLRDALGEPDDVFDGPLCELDTNSPKAHTVTYGALSALFFAEKGKTFMLQGWNVNLEQNLIGFGLDESLTTGLSFKDLKKKYPKGKLVREEILGNNGYIFTTPGGIRLTGDGNPDWLSAGYEAWCE